MRGGVCVQVKKEIPRKEQKWEHSEQKEQNRGNKERRRRINRSEEEGKLKEIWESASYRKVAAQDIERFQGEEEQLP